MKRFEYKMATREEDWHHVHTDDASDKVRNDRIAWMNELGNDGWDIVKVDFTPTGNPWLLLKRERDA